MMGCMKIYEPEIVVVEDYEEMSRLVSGWFVEDLKVKTDNHVSLPTGNTPKRFYELLVEAYEKEGVSFAELVAFNLDEYWPINPQSRDSYSYYMRSMFVNRVNMNENNWHIPNGAAEDPCEEAGRYDELIRKMGVDCAYMGLGPGLTNHIGFNEAGSGFDSRTRLVSLVDETIEVNKQHFSESEIVRSAITQGLGTILEADKIVMMISGEAKARGVKRFLEGEVGVESPASVLRTREEVRVVLDKAAASLLTTKA